MPWILAGWGRVLCSILGISVRMRRKARLYFREAPLPGGGPAPSAKATAPLPEAGGCCLPLPLASQAWPLFPFLLLLLWPVPSLVVLQLFPHCRPRRSEVRESRLVAQSQEEGLRVPVRLDLCVTGVEERMTDSSFL